MGICKDDGAHCRSTKVPGKVQSELVNSKHAPICNERSCDIVIVLLDFVVVLPDFVVESNKLCEHVSAQTITVCSHLLFAQQSFYCLGPAKFWLVSTKETVPFH